MSLIAVDSSVEEACAYAHIHYNTFYNWFGSGDVFLWEFEEPDPTDPNNKRTVSYSEETTFKDLVERARASMYVKAKTKLFEAMDKWDTRAIIEFLKRRSADYFDKQVVLTDSNDIVQDLVADLKDAKAQRLKRASAKRKKTTKSRRKAKTQS